MKRQDLLKALEIVKPGLSKKSNIEEASSFAFMNGEVVTYNDEISLRHPSPELNLTGAIQADELYQLLAKIKKDEIELTQEKNEIVIQSGKMTAWLVIKSEITLPIDQIGSISKWQDIPEDFFYLLKFAAGACSRDTFRPILTAVHVNGNIIEGSDNFRIIYGKLKNLVEVNEFLLPAASALQVIKLEPTKIAEGTGWIHFKTDEGTVMSCRVFQDEYPKIEHLLQVEGTEVSLPGNLDEIIDKACVFIQDKSILDMAVKITLTGNDRTFVESKSETGRFKEEANIRYKGVPIVFSITPYLLKDKLTETSTCIIWDRMVKFEGENWIYITALQIEK